MRKLLLAFVTIILSVSIYAQAPKGFSYQAVVRDNAGQIIPNQSVGVLISILQGSSTGTLVCSQYYTVTTNDFGLMTLFVGQGSPLVGNFPAIDWGANTYFLQVDIDVTGGTNYQTMGVTQLMSVPYALHATTVEVDNINDADSDPTNELQSWSNLPGIPQFIDTDYTNDFDGNYSSLLNPPSLISTFTNDVGYITNPDDADADPLNEWQEWAEISNKPPFLDQDYTDDFDGYWTSLIGTPPNISTFGNDVGYITNPNDGDFSPTNELQNWSNLPGIPANIDTDYTDDFDGNYGSLIGAPTNVSAFVNDAGYLTAGAAGWLLGGNAGTTTGTDFIGTTDNKEFDMRANNVIKWRYTPKGTMEFLNTGNSIFIGEDAGMNDNLTANNNVFVGYQAGRANTTGEINVAFGYQSLFSNSTGSDNTALGNGTLYSITSANGNTGVGSNALASNVTGAGNTAVGMNSLLYCTGAYNTALGYGTLFSNTVGGYNVAIGNVALYSNVGGSNNIGIGNFALNLNDNGAFNIAVGLNSLAQNTTGNNNIAIGQDALNSNITGINNTAVGAYANQTAANFSNTTALGYLAPVTGSNQVNIGNTSIISIRGQVGFTTYSDKRFKQNIAETVPGLDFIMKLRPVNYNLDMDAIANFLNTPEDMRDKESERAKAEMNQTGFIAQEVEAAANQLGFKFSGIDKPQNNNDFYGLRYAEFTVPLVKATQEQQVLIEQQQEEINELKLQLQQQKAMIEQMQQVLNGNN